MSADNAQETQAAYEGGQGSTLLLLHGLGGSWHIWKPVLAALGKRHRVVALTLPGHHGGTPLPGGVEPSVQAIVDVLEQDLRARGIVRPHVCGNSLGGWISLELVRRGLVQSATALSPGGGWDRPEDFKGVLKMFRIVFAVVTVLMVISALFLRFGFVRRLLNKQAMLHGDRVPPAELKGALNAIRNTKIMPRLLANIGETGPIQPLDVGDTPVTIAWAEKDLVIPYETFGRPILARVTGARALTMPGVGHVPMYDDPEQVVDIILQTTTQAEAVTP